MDEETGSAIVGAFAVLVDEGGEAVVRALTDDQGRFFLRALRPGRYRLRIERIGYASTESALLDLPAGTTLPLRMAVRAEAVPLEAIEVRGERRCASRPDRNAETASVWEEARKALEAAVWTEQQRLFRFTLRRWIRELDPATLEVRTDSTWYREGTFVRPFASVSVERLAREGYIVPAESGGLVYYAPDAQVLLSDLFLADHCFRTSPGRSRREGLIGLAFEPVRRRRVADVEGVLWLDRATAELRDVELSYTGETLPPGAEHASAQIWFERVSGGAWIVRRWWIRMPRMRLVHDRFSGPGGRMELFAVREEGGEVVQILPPDEE